MVMVICHMFKLKNSTNFKDVVPGGNPPFKLLLFIKLKLNSQK